MFREDFVWGVAASAYQIEGKEPGDGIGKGIWDIYADEGKIYGGHRAQIACDHMHRYEDDFAIMGALGIKAYRFSVNWCRILPEGTGKVNEKGVLFYRNLIKSMLKNGVTPYLTLYHWELPQALQNQGGWLNEKSIEWFGEYARVIAERFSDLVEHFITLNEPQCFVGLAHLRGVQAPGLKMSYTETFQIAHNALRAHGQAVINLRKYACRPIKVSISLTCGVAIPKTDAPADIEAARKVYFGFYNDMDNWAWNMGWFSDAVFLGKYPEEGVRKFKKWLPEITKEDMELISQPLDFMGTNIYNGYYIKAGENGEPQFLDYEYGAPQTGTGWPMTPECIYWGLRFAYERYHLPIHVTENGVCYRDIVSPDGRVHDTNRSTFLDAYLSEVQRAADEGVDVRGYFLWTFLDNFEWSEGYKDRFGIIYVDYATQKRTAKDSAYWYAETIRTNGGNLSMNQEVKPILFLNPVFKQMIWGGNRLGTDWGYPIPGDDTGECWAVSAHPNGDCVVREGVYAGRTLSELWEKEPSLFGNTGLDRFPLLIKIIDAKSDLSIQVHPDDTYAKKNENGSLGKTECWYILDCPEDAALVIGHNASSKEELRDMIEEKRWGELIREIPVKKGDFIQIDPGTVHAIKGGLMILETQQNSDITYRVYDYDRLSNGKPRELHIEKSIDVITVPAKPVEESVMTPAGLPENQMNPLIVCDYYKVWKLDVTAPVTFSQDEPFLIMSVIEGSGLLDGQLIKKGDHFILPSGYGTYSIQGNLEIIASTIKNEKSF